MSPELFKLAPEIPGTLRICSETNPRTSSQVGGFYIPIIMIENKFDFGSCKV